MDADRLDALLADAIAEQAGRDRAQERLLRQAAEESATYLGVLVDLVERAERVSVRTADGRTHRGRLLAVGRDFIVIRDGAKAPALVATAAVTTIRSPHATRHDTASRRRAPVDASFGAVLAGLAAERPRVQVGAAGEGALLGELRAVGEDVVTLRLDAEGRPAVYLPLTAVHDVVLLDV